LSKEFLFDLNLDSFRECFNKYTIKAFRILPELEKPRILDIGCGSGVPTIELARLSDGEIIGIDIDQESLDRLSRKIEREGLTKRVKAIKCSLQDIRFPDNSFDIIWAEGSITTRHKVASCGYKLIEHFSLPEEAWWEEYYIPLEIRIKELYKKYSNDPDALEVLNIHQTEIDMVKFSPKSFQSVFCIMQKIKKNIE